MEIIRRTTHTPEVEWLKIGFNIGAASKSIWNARDLLDSIKDEIIDSDTISENSKMLLLKSLEELDYAFNMVGEGF